jgi:hypothetical protein
MYAIGVVSCGVICPYQVSSKTDTGVQAILRFSLSKLNGSNVGITERNDV